MYHYFWSVLGITQRNIIETCFCDREKCPLLHKVYWSGERKSINAKKYNFTRKYQRKLRSNQKQEMVSRNAGQHKMNIRKEMNVRAMLDEKENFK